MKNFLRFQQVIFGDFIVISIAFYVTMKYLDYMRFLNYTPMCVKNQISHDPPKYLKHG